MTGPEHYLIAQDLALACSKPHSANSSVRILREHASPDVIALAQVHATLAVAAAAALTGVSLELPAAGADLSAGWNAAIGATFRQDQDESGLEPCEPIRQTTAEWLGSNES